MSTVFGPRGLWLQSRGWAEGSSSEVMQSLPKLAHAVPSQGCRTRAISLPSLTARAKVGTASGDDFLPYQGPAAGAWLSIPSVDLQVILKASPPSFRVAEAEDGGPSSPDSLIKGFTQGLTQAFYPCL